MANDDITAAFYANQAQAKRSPDRIARRPWERIACADWIGVQT